MFWENPGSFLPIIAGIAVFFLIFLSVNALVIDRLPWHHRNKRGWLTNIALAVSAAAGVATIMYFA